jgi:hypothetical protein
MNLVADNGLLMAFGCAHTFITVHDLQQALHTAAASVGKHLTVVQQHIGSRQLQSSDASTSESDDTTASSSLTSIELQEYADTVLLHADSSIDYGQHTSTLEQWLQPSTSSSSSSSTSSSFVSTRSVKHSVNKQTKPNADAAVSVSQDALSALERTQLLHAMAPHWLLTRCVDKSVAVMQ